MKTIIVFFLLVASPLWAVAQTTEDNLLRNGDFEKFAGDNPDSWETPNIPGTLTVVSPSKNPHAGARAVKCEVKEFGGALLAGYVCQKNIQTGGKDLQVSGAFLVRSVEKDRGVILLSFINSGGSTVGTTEEYIEETKSKYVEVSKEIKPPAGTAAVNMRVTIFPAADSEKAHVGSYIVCDDLKLVAMAAKEKPPVQ